MSHVHAPAIKIMLKLKKKVNSGWDEIPSRILEAFDT